jgi:hypothetical protein
MNEETKEKLLDLAKDLRPLIYTQFDCSVTLSFDSHGTTVTWTINDGAGGSESSSRRIAAPRKALTSPAS